MRLAFAAVFVLALAACNQGGPPPASTSTSSATTASAPSTAEMQAKVAALAAPYNAASYENGRSVFAQCRACHTINAGGINMVGPNLHGVIGRRIASVEGYNYSPALKAQSFTWDADHLEKWLEGPMTDIPGTRMSFPGVHNDNDRRDVIAFLTVESQQP
ncbi:MAG: cytochrome c family protein [Terricaulis sp.]